MEEFWNKNLSNSNNIAIIATKILHMSVVGNITFFLGCLFSINLDRSDILFTTCFQYLISIKSIREQLEDRINMNTVYFLLKIKKY